MAGTIDLSAIKLTTQTVQNATEYILWVGIGLAVTAVLGYFIFKLITDAKYKIKVVMHEKVGNSKITKIDRARPVKIGDT